MENNNSDLVNFRIRLQRWIQKNILPFHNDWEKNGIVPKEVFKLAGDDGFLCSSVSSQYGGQNLPFEYSAIVTEELTQVGATGPLFYIQSNIVAPFLEKFASENIKSKFIPRLVKGELIAAMANSEYVAGTDFSLIETCAILDGEEYILNGSKTYISNGGNADLFIVLAKLDRGEMGLFILEKSTPGFSLNKLLDKMGLRAQDTGELAFKNCRIPKENFLGTSRESKSFLQARLRASMAIFALGLAKFCFRLTKEHCSKRKAFGKNIIEFQNSQFKLAEMLMEITIAETYVEKIISLINQGHDCVIESSIGKLWITEMLGRIADQGLQLHGASGYMNDNPIAKAYLDARIQRIYGGATEFLKELIFKSKIGLI